MIVLVLVESLSFIEQTEVYRLESEITRYIQKKLLIN